MSDLEFAKPDWLHLIWAVIVIAIGLVTMEYMSGNSLGRFLSKDMQQRLSRSNPVSSRILGTIFFSLALVCFLIALMRPQYGFTEKKLPHVGAQIMICLDVSKSMLAEDASPNRLDRAKSELEILLNYLQEDQVGLIAFAGKSTVLSPMTTDFGYLKLLLKEATPSSVGRGGTMLEEPIRRAMNGFSDTSDMSRVIILITDGEDNGSKPIDAAKLAAERGVKIITIGFGDERGTRIQITDPETGLTDYVRDQSNRPVESRLDVSTLTKIAKETDGAFIPAGVGSLDFESIHKDHIEPLMRAQSETKRIVKNEAFQWPLLGGVMLLCLSIVTSNSLTFSRQSFPAWLEEKANDADVAPFGGRTINASSGKRTIASSKSGNTTKASIIGLAFVFAIKGLNSECLMAQAIPPTPRSTMAPTNAAPIDPATRDQAAIDRQRDTAKQQGGKEGSIGSEISSARSAEKPLPVGAINCYNRALPILSSDSKYAERLLEEARRNAKKDGELRFRLAYNLGWVKIYQAQESLKTKPKDALKSFEESASWFREAIRIRPRSDDSRHNLEIVMRRISELADSLRKKEERDFSDILEQIIRRQSQTLAETRKLLEQVSRAGNSVNLDVELQDDFKKRFRLLSVDQRLLNSDLQDLTFKALDEIDAFEKEQASSTSAQGIQNQGAQSSSANGPQNPTQLSREEQQKRIRIAQLRRAVIYTERAAQRLGQARSQMRFRNGERAARRAALGLDELNRARDQLKEPAEVIRMIMAEMNLLNHQTNAFQAGRNLVAAFLGAQTKTPKWLDLDYLKQFQQSQLERTTELAAILEGVLPNEANDPSAGPSDRSLENDDTSEQSNQAILIGEAAGFVSDAVSDLATAKTMLDASKLLPATKSQTAGIKNLAEAYERFADLKGLIELTHSSQSLLDGNVSNAKKLSAELRREVVESMILQQKKNLDRFDRMVNMVEEQFAAESAVAAEAKRSKNPNANSGTEEKSPELQQLEQARLLLPEIERHLNSLANGLNQNFQMPANATNEQNGDEAKKEEPKKEPKNENKNIDKPVAENDPWDDVVSDSKSAMENLDELRRLFFSIRELLKETAQRQFKLNGETTKASKRFQSVTEKIESDKGIDPKQAIEVIASEKSKQLGPISSRQSELEFISSQIQTGLNEQAEQSESQLANLPPEQASDDNEEQFKNLKEMAQKYRTASKLIDEAKTGMKVAIDEIPSPNKSTAKLSESQEIAYQKLAEALMQLTPPDSNEQQNPSSGQSSSQANGSDGDGGAEEDSQMQAIQQGIRDREAERRRKKQMNSRQDQVEKDW